MRHSHSAAEAFWRFSLALYARPGVAAALIALQDAAGRDVNLVLYALWLGAARGIRLDAAALTAAETAVTPANAVVLPLRELRRRLKNAADVDLREWRRRIAGPELTAERLAQDRLVAQAPRDPRPADAGARLATAAANLGLCLAGANREAEAFVLIDALAALIRHAPDAGED